MKSILLDLYYGNYSAASKPFPRNSAYAEALSMVCRLEEEMQEQLSSGQRDLFERYLNGQAALAEAAAEKYFAEGYRLGARLMLELNSEEENE